MKRLLTGVLALGVTMVPVVAADLIVDAPVYEAAVAQDWNGFYAGVFGGYGSGVADWDNFFADIPMSGLLAGIDVGYNYQADNFILGVEGDLAWSGVIGSQACVNPAFTCSTDVDWLGTLRGRAGFAADTVLVYATAGLAIGSVVSDTAPFTPNVAFSKTQVGWTAGAGLEVAMTQDLSLKAEYLYVDLGSATDATGIVTNVGNTTIATRFHAIKAGLNWHF